MKILVREELRSIWTRYRTPLIACLLGWISVRSAGAVHHAMREMGGLEYMLIIRILLDTIGWFFVAVNFYYLRRRMRGFYGVFEVAFGVAVLYASLYVKFVLDLPQWSEGARKIDFAEFSAASCWIAAVYVIVRGLDNVGSSFKPGSRGERVWGHWFPTTV